MPWDLWTTLLLTPRTGPIVVSMTRVRESAIASVTATPRTTRIDAERPMPARRSRQRTLLSRPSETSAVCRTPIVSSPCLSLDWDPKKRCCPDVRRSLYDRRTKLIQLRTTSTKQRQSRLKFKGCATPTQERGCRIVDGTGNPWFYADLAIKNGHTPLWRRHEGAGALDQAHGEGLER